MRPGELQAAGDIAATVLGGAVGMIRDVHLSIAERVFGAVGPAGRGVKRAHDGISRSAYGAVGEAHRWVPRLGATVGAATMPPDGPPLHSSRHGGTTLAAINGLWGDSLASAGNEFAIDMTVREARADVPITRAALGRAFPNPTRRLAVFVHGLCESERAWYPSERRQLRHGAFNFGDRLAEFGYTPVYLRFNSGLHISDNGARLSALLDELVDEWPTPIEELALIGHSMGGLVTRSACHRGGLDDAQWVDYARHIFCLGTPHLGAPLERGVNVLSWAMRRLPETRGLAAVLNARSAGVKDLRFGSLLEEDWSDVDLDEFLSGRRSEVPFSDRVNYYFIGVTITHDQNHPLGLLAGDLLVQFSSASGKGRSSQLPFDIDKGHHIGGLTHFDLLSHPDVYAQLERWLTRPGLARSSATTT